MGQAHRMSVEIMERAQKSVVGVGQYFRAGPIRLQLIPSNGPTSVLLNVGRQLRSGPRCRGRSHRMGPPECG